MNNKMIRFLSITFFSLLIVSFSSAQKTFIINGKVKEFDSKEPLTSVSISVSTIKKIFLSNDSGEFNITLPEGEYKITFSRVGYFTKVENLYIVSDVTLVIELKKKPTNDLDEVTVIGKNVRNKAKENDMGLIKINVEKLKQLPSALGEADILKAVAQQPGVTVAGEGAGGIYVRGGGADQNLVLLDEAPLFNTSHLLGFYTTVSPDVLQNVNLYKGSIPANYGGRISSLMNLNIKQNCKDDLQYNGGISAMSARFFANGALKKDKVGITIGGRFAYPNIIFKAFPKNFKDNSAFFYDAIAKLSFCGKDSSIFAITTYHSFDNFKFDDKTKYIWNSNVLSANYGKKLRKNLWLQATALYSGFESNIENLEKNYESKVTSTIAQKEGKFLFFYNPINSIKFKAGASVTFYNILPNKQQPTNSTSQINNITIPNEKANENAVFVNADINLTKKITFIAGLRYVTYNYLGKKTIYKYTSGVPLSEQSIIDSTFFDNNKKIKNHNGVEPRISFKYMLDVSSSIKLGYHRSQQFLHLVTNSTAISPIDYWKLADSYLPQQIGDQYSVGFYKNAKIFQYSIEKM
jgi:CarboxypepD_reg-like domain/TonB-dependent Receptor Plug Domain/TonB dependent receptor